MNKMEEEDDNSGDIVDPKVVQWVKREKPDLKLKRFVQGAKTRLENSPASTKNS